MPGVSGTLKRKVLTGGLWSLLSQAVIGVVGFVRMVVLARLLYPADFGLMGMSLIVMGALQTFSQTGFEVALIRQRGRIEPLIDVAFTVHIIRGLVLAMVLFLLAEPAAGFFGEPDLALLLKVLPALVLLQGFANPATVCWTRDLKFRTFFFWTLFESAVGLVVVLALAIRYANVWALVGGAIVTQAAKSVASHVWAPYHPRLALRWSAVTQLGKFSKWASGSSILSFLNLQGDNLFVGKFLGVATLGLYQVAFRITDLPVTSITQVVWQVAYPVWSQFQSDLPRLKRWYARTARLLLILNGSVAAAFILWPEILVRLALGEKWMPVIPTLRLLAGAAFVRSFVVLGPPLFYAVGRPELAFRMHAVRFGVMAGTIYFLARSYGAPGVALAVLLGLLATLPVYLAGIRTVLGLRWHDHIVEHE